MQRVPRCLVGEIQDHPQSFKSEMTVMIDWLFATLKQYPEIAIFLALALGYYFGKFTFKGIGLGSVTATLIAGVVIGQVGITINQPLKAFAFLMFLFAVGYGVGPQFVRGIAKDGVPQAVFSVVQCVLSLAVCVVIAKVAGYDLGYAAGFYAGSQTISASMGLATDAINRLGLEADKAKALIDSMPVAYAVTYMFGTMGSAVVIAVLGPKLLGIDLVAACKDYVDKFGGGKKEIGGAGYGWQRWALRAYKVQPGGKAAGLRVSEAEGLIPDARIFVGRIRRDGQIMDATADTVLKPGDVVAVAGEREVLVRVLQEAVEVEDKELLAVPVEGIDVLVTNKAVDGKTLAELAQIPEARGVFLRKITRGATATDIPILANTKINRGDLLTLVGRTQDISAVIKVLGVADRPTDVTDMAFVGAAIVVGGLIGAILVKVAGVPLTLSTAGGALIAGIIGGWLRSVRPSFGRIPTPTVWFMNSVGLNIFIAIVGISAGPGFVNGLKTQGIGLFLWGALATTLPLVLGMYIAKYLFHFHDALTLGIVSGARTTTASLGLVCDQAKSQIPALGYTVTYAVGNTLLTIWGMVIIMILS
jgi:putative transport protein